MNKTGLGSFVAVLLIMVASSAFAQNAKPAKDWTKGREVDRPPMMGMKMAGDLVATPDGGIVVLMGNRLYKFDKKLNLVKEVEIKVDKECQPGMMRCPMMPDNDREKGKKPGAPEDKPGQEQQHHQH